MTETKYTEKELQEMADALLKEADAQQHEIEEEVIKSNKGQLDEKTIASLPAAQLIQNNERLKELFIKGKRHGKPAKDGEAPHARDGLGVDAALGGIVDGVEPRGELFYPGNQDIGGHEGGSRDADIGEERFHERDTAVVFGYVGANPVHDTRDCHRAPRMHEASRSYQIRCRRCNVEKRAF